MRSPHAASYAQGLTIPFLRSSIGGRALVRTECCALSKRLRSLRQRGRLPSPLPCKVPISLLVGRQPQTDDGHRAPGGPARGRLAPTLACRLVPRTRRSWLIPGCLEVVGDASASGRAVGGERPVAGLVEEVFVEACGCAPVVALGPAPGGGCGLAFAAGGFWRAFVPPGVPQING